jgi:hypothetical protein
MHISDLYLSLGQDGLRQLLKSISMGSLRSYNLFERTRIRCHLKKLSSENLRASAPELYRRIEGGEEDLARELGQSILISNLGMIIEALDHLKLPHTDGFFPEDTKVAELLPADWQQKLYNHLTAKHPKEVVLFYINHLAMETDEKAPLWQATA